ncbi:hypothetical protein B0T26DRAFT_728614 [Lasiosphaeria miniovina]|uniref:CBF1-interacting co-repressor CIR N-terminal domain-containing protein n=1 Tax=Lasiosphaeria miniovina TaxID=1954250 RepID=A0AA40A099_9PEZI|nr:uncharacterized protein B0T26DRAFT_728614 [Lasiosphaeria miniovina]KAK0706928.1 hypothetical protein B0T26DRAFT_728614 [Lasiosphaeria miniovina]
MPLHLLGKKSWHVYNADNVARVQRDEAAARAREEADEERMQAADAERRLAILRGEVPLPLEGDEDQDERKRRLYGTSAETPAAAASRDGDSRRADRKKRKRAGEDDTDFEMRVAREQAEAGDRVARDLLVGPSAKPFSSASSAAAPLVDSWGHISLFGEVDEVGQQRLLLPGGRSNSSSGKNEEAEREAAQKKRQFQDQYQMRLVNAAGRDGLGLTDGGPWYAAPDGDSSSAAPVPSKNVFGRDDPGRKGREAARLDASDPLAMMKRGAAKVREVDKERRREAEERQRELESLKKEERRRKKHRRRREEGESGCDRTRDGVDRVSGRHAGSEGRESTRHRRRDGAPEEQRDSRHGKHRHRGDESHRHRSYKPEATDDRHRHDSRHRRHRDGDR